MEKKDVINAELLALFNRRTDVVPLLDRVVVLIKDYLGCDAVGIRLMDELGNIPYRAHSGFPEDFVSKEGPLCVTRDKCVCIYIGTGNYDLGNPLYTGYGSFMSGNLQELELVREGIKTGMLRGECQKRGWETIALVPVRFGHNYIGLMQAVDRRRDAVSADDLRFLENIAGQLGLYLLGLNAHEQKERELSYLIRRLMHDLRTPLTNSMLLTELIIEERAGRPDDEVSDYAGRMHRNLEYMVGLVATLDNFVIDESEASTAEDIDLGAFIRGVVEDVGIREGSGVEVIIPDGLPVIRYPWLGLRRLLNNLISNAVKFSADSKAPRVEIACEKKDTFYKVSVSDNGMGIADADVEKVFFPLYRTTSARDIPGTGIGLSICKRVVEANGGRIWVYSKPGVGSTFYFTIPI